LSLRLKTTLMLLLVLIPVTGILGMFLGVAIFRIEEESQRHKGLLLRERVLNSLRSQETALRQTARGLFTTLREDPENACSAERLQHRRSKALLHGDLVLMLDSRGEILWQEGLGPQESLVLPPLEILINPPASEDAFLLATAGEKTFLLAGTPPSSSEEAEEEGYEAMLFLGKTLRTLLPCSEPIGSPHNPWAFQCLFLTEKSSRISPKDLAIVHEIDGSGSSLLQLFSREEGRSSFLLRGWDGKPQVLLSFSPSSPGRNSQIRQTLIFHGILLFILGISLFFLIAFVLHRLIIQRLHKLAGFLHTLVQESRFAPSPQRLVSKGTDEISRVEQGINTLLDTLGEIRREERQNEQQLLALANNIPGAVYRSRVDRQFTKIFVSENFETLTGYKVKDILGNHRITITDIAHPEDRVYLLTTFWKQIEEQETFSIHFRILRSDGEYIWVHDSGQVTRDETTGERFIDGVILDMTELKKTEMHLQEEKNRYKELTDSLPQTIFETDLKGIVRFMNRNGFASFGYLPRDLEHRQLSWLDLFEEDHKITARRCMKRLFDEDREISTELNARTARGKAFPAALYINPVRQMGEIEGVLGIIIDLSAQKTMEEKLRFLSMHDSLTGLYNRAFFEEEMHRMETRRFDPLGAVMCDLDGLKLVNDIMGHAAGDRLLIATACILRQTFRSSDIIARIGGDEFAVLLPQCPKEQMHHILERLQKNMEAYNAGSGAIPLSLSVGSTCRETSKEEAAPISVETLMNEADSKMYRQKLRQSARVRKNFVEKLHTNFCNAAMPNAKGHQHHARDIMLAFWKHLGKPESEEANVGLFALFHDIGYIGIPPEIAGKPGPLTSEEWEIIYRHPEIGHRIALSSPELAPVAEWILKHHERSDGKGYPLGIQGEEIPAACLLFALVDAYTCMINHRPFQKACSPEEAFEEIRRYRGIQFDATYTDIFLEFMESHPELHHESPENA